MSYFALVHLHYVMLFILTKNWTILLVGGILLSYLLFNPGFVFIYNAMPDTTLSERIAEVLYNNGHFWMISIIALAASVLPIFFYWMV